MCVCVYIIIFLDVYRDIQLNSTCQLVLIRTEDGYDETLVPVDYASAGQIRDDDLFQVLVGSMPAGVTVTCIMDCCHSGTVLDLPFQFVADGESNEMTVPADFDFGKLMGLAQNLAAALAAANGGQGAMNMISEAGCCTIL
jgi:metacaspase-1